MEKVSKYVGLSLDNLRNK